MRWFLLTSTVKSIRILQFYQPAHSNKNQITEKQEFSPKKHSCITLKRQKKKVSTQVFGNSDGFY